LTRCGMTIEKFTVAVGMTILKVTCAAALARKEAI
jgi:hypothetical protein